MKKQILVGLGAALCAAVLGVVSAPVDAAQMRCDIPFSFEVNNVTLPAGVYTVSTEASILSIRGLTRGSFALTNNLESLGETSPKLVFHRYGDVYILREAWTGGNSGRALMPTRREKELTEGKGAVAAYERVVIPMS